MRQTNDDNQNIAITTWKYRAYSWPAYIIAIFVFLALGKVIDIPSGVFGFVLALGLCLTFVATKIWIDALRNHKKVLWF